MAAKKIAKKTSPKAKEMKSNLLALINKKFGAATATSPGAEARALGGVREYIPTMIDVLDHYVLGNGGLPVGRMSEVFGPNACGKTALLYRSMASVQKLGGTAVLVDMEQSFDDERAAVFGVDLDELLILDAGNAEKAMLQIHFALENHNARRGPMLIGVDSIAALIPQEEIEGGKNGRTVGAQARFMSQELKKLPRKISKSRTHLMFLNQIRTKLGVVFGDNTATPGGNAPAFYASSRLQFFGGKALKDASRDNEHVGKVVTIMAIKNRMAPPFRKARVRFDYATGYNNLWSTLEHAKRFKLIEPRDAKGVGKRGLEAYLDATEALEWPAREEQAPEEMIDESDDDADE